MRRLISSGASVDDYVVVLVPEPPACDLSETPQKLRELMVSYGLGEPKLVKVPSKPSEGISKVMDVIEECGCRELVIDISDGARYLGTYLLLALFLLGRDATIYVGKCGDEEIVIPPTALGIAKISVSKSLYDILSIVVSKPGVTDNELSVRTGKKEKTIKVLAAELGKLGLIYRKGRAAGIYPSRWANVAVKSLRSKLGF